MNRGYLPQKPVTIVTENGDEAAIEAVSQRVDKAQATADNARQMVVNRDPRLNTLEGLAADYQQRVSESQADRAALHTAVASLAADVQNEAENRADADAAHQVAISGLNARLDNIQLTPGPEGKQGPEGKPGRDGADGKDGAAGRNGTDGATGSTGPAGADGRSAYQLARDKGYGGTETQWLASLKGDAGQAGKDGPTGATGPAGQTGPAGRDANVQVEYRDGINVPAITVLNLGAATVDVTVTWPTAFPDANYTVTPQLTTTNSALIGKATASVKSKTAASAVITVTTTALLSVGALVLSAVAIRKTT